MGICHLSLITKPLDKLCVAHSFKRTPPPSLTYFHGKSPKIPENLFAVYHSPRIQCNCEKTPKFPSILKSH